MKEMNLLMLGAFNKGSLENFYLRGFEKEGVSVTTFDIISPYYAMLNKSAVNRVINRINPSVFYKPINKTLQEFTGKTRYDAILIFKGMQLLPETISYLKKHTAILANYNTDHPFKFWSAGSGNKNILDSISLYDLHFSYAKNIVARLVTDYGSTAYCVPFGYDRYASPEKNTSAGDFSESFLFVGACDDERSKYLNEIKLPELAIYGDDAWHTRNWKRPYIQKAFRHKKLYDDDYSFAVRSSKGVINLLRKQNMEEDSHNMRTFEVPGYGGLLITQRTTEQMEYFEENKEAVFFDSTEELNDKLLFLRNHTSVAEQIKTNAFKRSVNSGYSYDERSKQLLTVIRENLQ